MDLYADYHPQTSVKGFGFANAQKAHDTLKMLADGKKKKNLEIYQKIQKNPNYEIQVVITMYYRAKHHPQRTSKMEEAMAVYQKFLQQKGVKVKDKKRKGLSQGRKVRRKKITQKKTKLSGKKERKKK